MILEEKIRDFIFTVSQFFCFKKQWFFLREILSFNITDGGTSTEFLGKSWVQTRYVAIYVVGEDDMKSLIFFLYKRNHWFLKQKICDTVKLKWNLWFFLPNSLSVSFARKTPLKRPPPFILGKSRFCLKGIHRKSKTPFPPSKVEKVMEGGSFWRKGLIL